MTSIVQEFISRISSHSGCYKDVKASFASLQNNIKKKKVTLGKRDIKLIVETVYEETRKYPELNKLWGTYTNILQYNNKEVRRLIVERLVEQDVKNKEVCPHRVLELLFKDKEMVKLIRNRKTYFQAALQVKELCPTYLPYLGGDKSDGKQFRGQLGDFIIDNFNSLFFSKESEEISKCIENVIIYIGVSRSKLHQIDDCDIASNFLEFKRIHTNLNFDAYEKGNEKDYRNHTRPIKDHELCNYKNLISNYENGRVKKEIFLENLYNIMLDIDKREELINYLEKTKNELFPTFKCLKLDGDCDFGVIPKEIVALYTGDKYPSINIIPTIGNSYFSYQKSLFFTQCNPKKCYQPCDKSSHHDRFNMTLVEDSETACKIIEDLRGYVEKDDAPIFFMDIKLSIKDKTEEITYINIFFPNSELKSKFISFNLEKISNSQTSSNIVEFFFSTKNYIVCYNDVEMKNKFKELFTDVFRHDRGTDFPFSTVIGLVNRLNTIVEAGGEKCSIPRYFPETWKDAYKYKSIDYTNYSDNEVEEVHSDNEITITKQQRRCIRKMSKNMEFRNLCYLTTGYDYDESESEPYSFWHRKPLRTQQRQEMLTRLVALFDIFCNLTEAMSKDPDYKDHGTAILTVRVGNCKFL